MLCYYEIVRLENQGPDREEFETVSKMIDRGWVNKAHNYLQQWNYGGENVSAAISLGTMRSTVTDFHSDRVVKTVSFSDGSRCHLCATGGLDGYEAVYLVGEYDNAED